MPHEPLLGVFISEQGYTVPAVEILTAPFPSCLPTHTMVTWLQRKGPSEGIPLENGPRLPCEPQLDVCESN